MPETIEVVALVRWEAGRLLLVRADYQTAFYLPGGKIDPGETHEQALHREVREELGTGVRDVRFLDRYVADAVGQGEGVRVGLNCYTGELVGTPAPAAEIAELAWMSRAEYLDQRATAPAIVALYADLG
ncbi:MULTISPECIES: NUDIX hydrolase [Saccharopolyspora]|uniref:NUDIX domain-containing protein n=1 Tax=Saccharopolyspora cebuensis TaxID=418759 RepID=A0ABV4CM04_9PSEU